MIRIIADTTCALPLEQLQALGIPVLPQIIIFGEESYRDDYELTTDMFFQKLRASTTLPKTAAPPPALYEPIYKKYLEQGDSILVITPSEDVSGTYRGAITAAGSFPGAPIHVFDSRAIAGMLGAMVLLAHRWAKEAMTMEEVKRRLGVLQNTQRTYFVVDTLEYLHRGGRIGGAKRLVGEMLQVKPILRLHEGHVEPFEQPRTKRKALQRLEELVVADCPHGEGTYLSVMHADAEAPAQEIASALRAAFGLRDVPIYKLPPAIAVHAGPGVLAVGFFSQAVHN